MHTCHMMPCSELPAAASLYHTQPTNIDTFVKHQSDWNFLITFIFIILIQKKYIKMHNYIRNESTIALLEWKLLTLLKAYLMCKFRWHDPCGVLLAWVTIMGNTWSMHPLWWDNIFLFIIASKFVKCMFLSATAHILNLFNVHAAVNEDLECMQLNAVNTAACICVKIYIVNQM